MALFYYTPFFFLISWENPACLTSLAIFPAMFSITGT